MRYKLVKIPDGYDLDLDRGLVPIYKPTDFDSPKMQEKIRGLPIVPADTYENVTFRQEFLRLNEADKANPRRHVLMRGSLDAMIEKHGGFGNHCANKYCWAVAERYLRRRRITCMDYRRAREWVDSVLLRVSKGRRTTYHLWNRYEAQPFVLVNGRIRMKWEFAPGEFTAIRKLHSLEMKAGALEYRMAREVAA